MQVSGETKFFAGVIVATIAILGFAITFLGGAPKEQVDPNQVLGVASSDAWATGSATPKVTLVEFSDFE